MVSQLGISIMTPIFLCTYIGYRIDRHFGTKLIIPFLILGTLSGANMAYRMVKSVLKSRDEEESDKDRARGGKSPEVLRPKTKSRIFKED
ncbi:MAG: AtpZ/AtpI family protein [Johnsonella sp.]|nr:AtpZ/AtpI family protein [Johnsonella sp.]